MDAVIRKLKGITFHITLGKLCELKCILSGNRNSFFVFEDLQNPKMMKIIENDNWDFNEYLKEWHTWLS